MLICGARSRGALEVRIGRSPLPSRQFSTEVDRRQGKCVPCESAFEVAVAEKEAPLHVSFRSFAALSADAVGPAGYSAHAGSFNFAAFGERGDGGVTFLFHTGDPPSSLFGEIENACSGLGRSRKS